MWRSGFFEQVFATMPISDYASAFFFAHRKRVTLRCSPTLPRRSGCNLKSTAGQGLASIWPGAVATGPGLSSRIEPVKTPEAHKNFAGGNLPDAVPAKIKSPAGPGF
jgi:hypothetical protein